MRFEGSQALNLFLLRCLHGYRRPISIRLILEYGAEIWNGGLTQEQKRVLYQLKNEHLVSFIQTKTTTNY